MSFVYTRERQKIVRRKYLNHFAIYEVGSEIVCCVLHFVDDRQV